MNPPLIIDGSARTNGDTAALVGLVRDALPASVAVTLASLDIAPFAYGHRSQDAFGEIVAAMLRTDDVVFATPIYWYAMSGRMKTLFDRFTDLLHDGELRARARGFAGRRTWLLTIGTDPKPPPGFDEPFARTSKYLAMNWSGSAYVNSRGDDWPVSAAPVVAKFVTRLGVARGFA